MRNNRLWILGCSILTVAILALGVLLGISPRLIEAQDADAQRQQVASNNAALRIQTAALKEQYENIDDLRAQLEELSKEVPADASLDDFFDELSALAIANGMKSKGKYPRPLNLHLVAGHPNYWLLLMYLLDTRKLNALSGNYRYNPKLLKPQAAVHLLISLCCTRVWAHAARINWTELFPHR